MGLLDQETLDIADSIATGGGGGGGSGDKNVKLYEDGAGNAVLEHETSGATFVYNGNAWVPSDDFDLEGADVQNVGTVDSDETTYTEQSNPPSVPAGERAVYADDSGDLYQVNPDGTTTALNQSPNPQPNLADLVTRSGSVLYYLSERSNSYRSFANGSAELANTEVSISLLTGSTSGSKVWFRDGSGSYKLENQPGTWKKDRSWTAEANFTDLGDVVSYLGCGKISEGLAGFGFKLVDDDLLGIVNEGTSETTTTLINGFDTQHHRYRCEYRTGEEVEFFVDGTSRGTITGPLPTGRNESKFFAHVSIENTAAVERRININTIRSVQLP